MMRSILAVVLVTACGGPPKPPPAPEPKPDAVSAATPKPDVKPIPPPDPEPPPGPEPLLRMPIPEGWLKGQLHLHSANSPDSPTLPMDVISKYEELGFDFLVFTDHNYTTEFVYDSDELVLITGAELTTNPDRCTPPPEKDMRCRMHVNALFLPSTESGEMPWDEENHQLTDFTRLGLYKRHLKAVKRLGGVAMINHPRWYWGVDGKLLAKLARKGLLLVEIANQGFPSWNLGDETHPGGEAMWDDALSRGVTLWGVASDDAHHYYSHEIDARIARGKQPYPPGLAWVMVRADKNADAIKDAVVRGDFYSSTGVILSRLEVTAQTMEIELGGDATYTIAFIGKGGKVLKEVTGNSASFSLADAKRGYVRAVVTDSDGRKAWIQPVRVK